MTSIFEDKSMMVPDSAGPSDYGISRASSSNAPFGVATVQTPDQQRAVVMSNYPRHGWGDVRNLRNVRRGHGY